MIRSYIYFLSEERGLPSFLPLSSLLSPLSSLLSFSLSSFLSIHHFETRSVRLVFFFFLPSLSLLPRCATYVTIDGRARVASRHNPARKAGLACMFNALVKSLIYCRRFKKKKKITCHTYLPDLPLVLRSGNTACFFFLA